jgi:hypothetical protein
MCCPFTSPAAAKISKPAAQKTQPATATANINASSKHKHEAEQEQAGWQLSQAASGFNFTGRQHF